MRVCVVSVIVKHPVLTPCAVDGRSRIPLYYKLGHSAGVELALPVLILFTVEESLSTLPVESGRTRSVPKLVLSLKNCSGPTVLTYMSWDTVPVLSLHHHSVSSPTAEKLLSTLQWSVEGQD